MTSGSRRHGDGSGRLAVLAPSPVLTVGLGPGAEVHFHAGGQGFWLARMVVRLGVSVALAAPIGGESGRVLHSLVPAEGVELLAVSVARPNGVSVSDLRSGERRRLQEIPSPVLDRHEVDELYGLTLAAGLSADVAVLTGTDPAGLVPDEIYRRLARDLRDNGVLVVADLSGSALAAAVAGGLDLLKLSHEELIVGRLRGRRPGRPEIWAGIARLHAAGAQNVLVSRAEEPALAAVGSRCLEITAPRFVPLDHHGAGDAMTAALAAALAQGREIEDALRMAAAAGALNVTRRGLGTGDPRAIDRLADRACGCASSVPAPSTAPTTPN